MQIQITVTAIIQKKNRLIVEFKNVFLSFFYAIILDGHGLHRNAGCGTCGVWEIKSILNLCSKKSRTIHFWAVIDRLTVPLFFLITLHFLLQCLRFFQTNTFLLARAARVAFHTHSIPFHTFSWKIELWQCTSKVIIITNYYYFQVLWDTSGHF